VRLADNFAKDDIVANQMEPNRKLFTFDSPDRIGRIDLNRFFPGLMYVLWLNGASYRAKVTIDSL